MTKPLPIERMKRPMRRVGEMLTYFLVCPWTACRGPLRVVAYRARTARLECRTCGQRFSVDAEIVERLEAAMVEEFGGE
jgi:hypothetical protein